MLIRLPLWHTRCVRSGLPMNKVTLWLVAIFLVGAVAIAEAQQPAKIPRIGYLRVPAPHSDRPDFGGIPSRSARSRLRRGKNIVVEYRYAEGKTRRLPDLAAELVRLKVDVIVASDCQQARRCEVCNENNPHCHGWRSGSCELVCRQPCAAWRKYHGTDNSRAGVLRETAGAA